MNSGISTQEISPMTGKKHWMITPLDRKDQRDHMTTLIEEPSHDYKVALLESQLAVLVHWCYQTHYWYDTVTSVGKLKVRHLLLPKATQEITHTSRTPIDDELQVFRHQIEQK